MVIQLPENDRSERIGEKGFCRGRGAVRAEAPYSTLGARAAVVRVADGLKAGGRRYENKGKYDSCFGLSDTTRPRQTVTAFDTTAAQYGRKNPEKSEPICERTYLPAGRLKV